MKHIRALAIGLLRMALLGSFLSIGHRAGAQLVINEVFQNPPGTSEIDQDWEYIELYGRPHMPLDGYAVALIADQARRCGRVEIIAAFRLDGWKLGDDGLFVLANTSSVQPTGVSALLPANKSFRMFEPETPENPRFQSGASFETTLIRSSRTLALRELTNDGSSTWMIIRARPQSPERRAEAILGDGNIDAGWASGTLCDNNYDGKLDWGNEQDGCAERARLEPFQMVDEVAWSNESGIEYTRSLDSVLAETPGFNPDAISRLSYFETNPKRGVYTRDLHDAFGNYTGFQILPTTTAQESFIAGEIELGSFPRVIRYFDGFDMQGWYQIKAPTDPTQPGFNLGCDPEPDSDPFPLPCGGGQIGDNRLTDLECTGFELTPGRFNDRVGSQSIQQFRFLPGDFNFDGIVDREDLRLIRSRKGATLDDKSPMFGGYQWEGASFQQLLMMTGMDQGDNPQGDPSLRVTDADIAAVEALIILEKSDVVSRTLELE